MQTNHEHRQQANVFECAVCGNGAVVLDPGSTVPCPDCGRSHVLHVRDGFAMVETDGWTTRVTMGAPTPESNDA